MNRGPNLRSLSAGGVLTAYLFPYAGGGIGAFRPWVELFGPVVNVRAAQLPGRQDRFTEPCYETFAEAITDLADEVAAAPPREEFVFFGHSMGAVVAFEVARELRRRGARLPLLLGASGTCGPAIARTGMKIDGFDDERLAAASLAAGGLPDEVADNPDLLELVLPSLRSDLTILDQHPYAVEPPLPVPISAFGGEDDALVTLADLEAWQAETSAGFTLRTYPGGHFYLWDQGPEIVKALLADLENVLSSPAEEVAR